MPAAEYTSTTITVAAGDYELAARGRIVRFDGYTRVQPPAGTQGRGHGTAGPGQGRRPEAAGAASRRSISPRRRRATARPSWSANSKSAASVGPSTYASIISTIQDRGYVRLENRRFYAEKMGEIVTDRLQGSFSDLLDYGFTAGMEEHLDEVAGGRVWTGGAPR
jgi:DNA topoisomerase-1